MKLTGKRQMVWFGVMALLLVGTAYTILRQQSPGELAGAIARADGRILLLTLPVMALFIACEAGATRLVLGALGCAQPFRRCYFYSCTGFFFSNITPSATGGQPAQVYYMNRDGVPVVSGTIDMLLVSIGYHTAVVGYALAALYFGRSLLEQLGGQVGLLIGVGLSIFLGLNVAMILLLFLPGPSRRLGRWGIALACRLVPRLDQAQLEEKLEKVLEQYRQGARVIARNPLVLAGVVGLSAAQLACSYLIPYLVYRAFGLSGMGLVQVAGLQVLCSVAVGFLPLPGSAGAAEGVFLRSFLVVFGTQLVAPAMILTRTVSCYLVLMVTGMVTLVGHLRRNRRNVLGECRKSTCNSLHGMVS